MVKQREPSMRLLYRMSESCKLVNENASIDGKMQGGVSRVFMVDK